MSSESELVSNRKAFYNYAISDTYEAGVALLGTEIKSLRDHGGSLQDAYVLISDLGEAWLKNASIAPYRFGSVYNHEERRPRRLLLHKAELRKLHSLSGQKGFTLIPLAIYLKNGYAKVKIGVAKGKKAHDKRAALKAKEQKKIIREHLL